MNLCLFCRAFSLNLCGRRLDLQENGSGMSSKPAGSRGKLMFLAQKWGNNISNPKLQIKFKILIYNLYNFVFVHSLFHFITNIMFHLLFASTHSFICHPFVHPCLHLFCISFLHQFYHLVVHLSVHGVASILHVLAHHCFMC